MPLGSVASNEPAAAATALLDTTKAAILSKSLVETSHLNLELTFSNQPLTQVPALTPPTSSAPSVATDGSPLGNGSPSESPQQQSQSWKCEAVGAAGTGHSDQAEHLSEGRDLPLESREVSKEVLSKGMDSGSVSCGTVDPPLTVVVAPVGKIDAAAALAKLAGGTGKVLTPLPVLIGRPTRR